MGDAQGRRSTGSSGNKFIDDLHRDMTGDVDTLVDAVANI